MKKIRSILIAVLFSYPVLSYAIGYNDVAVDFPVDGGVMASYSRMYPLTRFLDAGFTVGGGLIQKEFDETVGSTDIDFKTDALVLPYIGPRATLHFGVIGFSIGYGMFYAKTDIDAEIAGEPKLTGDEKGWGSGFYTPLLIIDFYNQKSDIYWGLGIGGLLGTSYPDLEATNGSTRVITHESPISTVTLTVRARWVDGRRNRGEKTPRQGEFE